MCSSQSEKEVAPAGHETWRELKLAGTNAHMRFQTLHESAYFVDSSVRSYASHIVV